MSNGILSDPYIGTTSEQIPDAFHHRELYTYVWRRQFHLPAGHAAPERQIWLRLNGINYSFRAWLNGRQLTKGRQSGMFLRHQFNITDCLQPGCRRQDLRLLIRPPDHPGCCDRG